MRAFMAMMLLFCSSFLTGCIGCTHIEPGNVGVEIISCGDGRGVTPGPIGVGYHTTGTCTRIIEYPTYVQNVVWTRSATEGKPINEEITFTNVDQLQIAADISVAYQLDPDKVPAFYTKFKASDLETFTHGFLRNIAREKFDKIASKYKIEAIMGDNDKFLTEVKESLQKEVDAYGVKIIQFGFVGAPRPPQGIINAINLKIESTQRTLQLENELKQAEAQARKQVAQAEGEAKSAVAHAEGEAKAMEIRAKAEAEANRIINASISPTLVEYKKAGKWDGKLPQVSGGAIPMINLK